MERLLPREVDTAVLDDHRRENGGDAVENNAGRETDIDISAVRLFDYDAHGLLHEYAYGVAVCRLYFQQISHKALSDKFHDL